VGKRVNIKGVISTQKLRGKIRKRQWAIVKLGEPFAQLPRPAGGGETPGNLKKDERGKIGPQVNEREKGGSHGGDRRWGGKKGAYRS